jgi:hypothetical protein
MWLDAHIHKVACMGGDVVRSLNECSDNQLRMSTQICTTKTQVRRPDVVVKPVAEVGVSAERWLATYTTNIQRQWLRVICMCTPKVEQRDMSSSSQLDYVLNATRMSWAAQGRLGCGAPTK